MCPIVDGFDLLSRRNRLNNEKKSESVNEHAAREEKSGNATSISRGSVQHRPRGIVDFYDLSRGCLQSANGSGEVWKNF
jgi:hypothetical protein